MEFLPNKNDGVIKAMKGVTKYYRKNDAPDVLINPINWASLQVHPGSWTPPRLDVDVMFCSYPFDSDGNSRIAAHPKGASFVHATLFFSFSDIYL